MAKQSNNSADGWATAVGVLIVGLVAVVALVPKQIWIGLGVVAIGAVLFAVIYKVFSAVGELNADLAEPPRANKTHPAPAAKLHREGDRPQGKAEHQKALGSKNTALVESARTAVKRVVASEAARAGWLGDVDFTADIEGIVNSFHKAHALRQTADQLAALDNPSADDRKILGEAKTTAAKLERAAVERVKLIEKCAVEAKLIDESLRQERQDARTAQQRAELHAKLSAMLYGIEATPDTTSADSAADAVMARVQAYREIKNQIGRAREDG